MAAVDFMDLAQAQAQAPIQAQELQRLRPAGVRLMRPMRPTLTARMTKTATQLPAAAALCSLPVATMQAAAMVHPVHHQLQLKPV